MILVARVCFFAVFFIDAGAAQVSPSRLDPARAFLAAAAVGDLDRVHALAPDNPTIREILRDGPRPASLRALVDSINGCTPVFFRGLPAPNVDNTIYVLAAVNCPSRLTISVQLQIRDGIVSDVDFGPLMVNPPQTETK